MGETRVDLLHLLEDLRDAYPGRIEETILTEIVANSLDSGASRIDITCDPQVACLVAVDDGYGMRRRDLARYHNIAPSTKKRGEGIGFAGVGIKLGLLAAEEVVTESRRGAAHVATSWRLSSRHRAPWKWIEPPGLVAARGTAVRLKIQNPLSPLLDAGFVEATLQLHFQSLVDPDFRDVLSSVYEGGIELRVNDRRLIAPSAGDEERDPIQIRLPRKRKPPAAGPWPGGSARRFPMSWPACPPTRCAPASPSWGFSPGSRKGSSSGSSPSGSRNSWPGPSVTSRRGAPGSPTLI